MTERNKLIRKLLVKSLIKLLEEKSIHEISVREICDDAEINRATFYTLFSSTTDVLTYLQDKIIEGFANHFSLEDRTHSTIYENLLMSLTRLKEHRKVVRIALNNSIDADFPKKLVKIPRIHKSIEVDLDPTFSDESKKYYISFIVAGAYTILKKWLNNNCDIAVDEMAKLLMSIGHIQTSF